MIAVENYIPLDKSWIIRYLALDILNGYQDGKDILKDRSLSDDISRALNASIDWKVKDNISVGESATLLRFLKYIGWFTNTKKNFLVEGTLLNRYICDDPSLVNLSLEDLLLLDGGTSQWASISYICGNRSNLPSKIPYKLQVTIDACDRWETYRKVRFPWDLVHDETIQRQVIAFFDIINHDKTDWTPIQSEDYCFARAFGIISTEEGEKLWPSLINHETNRIIEMESAHHIFSKSGEIVSKDHRVIQSMVLYAISKGFKYKCLYPNCVNKSWPEFWKFVKKYEI